MKTIFKTFIYLFFALTVVVGVSCKKEKKPEIPETVETVAGEPVLKVYNTSTSSVENLNLENYLYGVVAGEMSSSWPIEALKAQAILARSYTMYFLANNKSKFEGADISTDITEAQAYVPSEINENIKKAVDETKGKIVAVDGRYVQTWFHANAGGKTATAKEGLKLWGDEPESIKIASSPETTKNSENAVWQTTLSKSDVLNALRKMNISVSNVANFEIGEKGKSGRAVTFQIGGKTVSAPEFRIAVGSTKFKSTFITKISSNKNGFFIEGKGFGHGVGLSQWGAKIMAEDGKNAEQIIGHYFKNVDIVRLY